MNEKQPFPNRILTVVTRNSQAEANARGEKRSIWQVVDEFIHDRRLESKVTPDIYWSESVFMPLFWWPVLIEKYFRLSENSFKLNDRNLLRTVQTLSCLAAWRPTQDIVKFDPVMAEELKLMKPEGKLPSEILSRLPAWGIWVDVPVRIEGTDYVGFFAQLDQYNLSKPELCLALTFQEEQVQHRVVLALGDFTIEESLDLVKKNDNRIGQGISSDDPGIIQALNLVTYICSYGLCDSKDYVGGQRNYPKPEKTKKGWRIFPPLKPRMHTLGTDFGDMLRKTGTVAGLGGAKVRPHIRRPHWHHFWKGSGASRTLIVHWLPPIFVGDQERFENENE